MNIETACIVPPVHIGCEGVPSYWDSHVRDVGHPPPPVPLCEKKKSLYADIQQCGSNESSGYLPQFHSLLASKTHSSCHYPSTAA